VLISYRPKFLYLSLVLFVRDTIEPISKGNLNKRCVCRSSKGYVLRLIFTKVTFYFFYFF
jgi:hypothetical protein